MRNWINRFTLVMAIFIASHVAAVAQSCNSNSCAASTNTSYGYYDWQVDEYSTLTFTSETGFSSAPGSVFIPVNVPFAKTIHEVHGHFAYAVWGTSCVGSIIAQVTDQNGNVIAAANPLQFGKSTIDIPVNGTFPNGLAITSLQMSFYQGQCGSFTYSWSLTMD